METGVKGRFAPSPSGRAHLGNILCCLLAWLSARQSGGRVVLRIEDLDTARCPRRYADQMEADLLRLGLSWDEGPGGGPDGPYYQSLRTDLYQAALEKLAGREKVMEYLALELEFDRYPREGAGLLELRERINGAIRGCLAAK